MNWPPLLVISLPLLAVAVFLPFAVRRLRRNPRGTLLFGVGLAVVHAYARLLHRLRVDGREHLADLDLNRGLIIVANHTAGVDPVLVQAALPVEVRWMMARDMAEPRLDRFWNWLRVIRVNRDAADARSLLTAVRHVREGGVLGLFPEGFLERPPRQLRPFRPGLGLLVARCGCPVLPIVIEDTPQYDPPWASLFRMSRSRLRILPLLEASELPNEPAAITQHLQDRFAAATRWPVNEAPPPASAEPRQRSRLLGALRGQRVEDA